MAKKKAAKKSKTPGINLKKEIPTLHSLVIILYILLGICFLAIFLTR